MSAAWWIAAAAVNPIGDFPLNDDWGYGPAARALVEAHTLRFTDWQSMPLISHALWGALFCLPFGFSYTALRFATLSAAWLGVLALYALLRQLGSSRYGSAIGAATLAFNPIYFVLACSFMTDAPFVAAMIAGTAAWLRATRTNDLRWRVVAVALVLAATLNRQLGIALPIAWVMVEALRHGLRWRWVRDAVLPAIVVLASLLVYERAIEATIGLPSLYHAKTREFGEALGAIARLRGWRFPIERSGITLMYLGLFTAPIIVLAWGALVKGVQRWLPALGALAGAALAIAGAAMPLTANVWCDFGFGPRTLPGAIEGAPAAVSVFFTAAGGATAVALAVATIRSARSSGILPKARVRALPGKIWEAVRRRDAIDPHRGVPTSTWLLLALTALLAFGPTAIAFGAYFDRYILVQLPFLIAIVVVAIDRRAAPSRASIGLSAAVLASMMALTVPAAHDYLAWQRARWDGVSRLEGRGIARAEIEGGFEVDNYPPPQHHPIPVGIATPRSASRRSEPAIMARPDAPWAIAISALEGFETIERIEVPAWLPWSIRTIHVAHRR